MSVTFSTVAIVRPIVTSRGIDFPYTETLLLSARVCIQGEAIAGQTYEISGKTTDIDDIADLAALTPNNAYTLTIESETPVTNCKLLKIKIVPLDPKGTLLEYTAIFKKDTSIV